MLSGTTKTTTTAPAPSPFSLDERVTPVRGGLFTGGMLLGVLLFGIGAAVARLGLSEPIEYRDMGGWIWLFIGLALVVAGGAVFVLALSSLWSLARYEVKARQLWTEQVLSERQQHGGVITQESETEWTLSASDPRDLLLVAIACYWQSKYRGQDAPWSVRSLRRLEISDGQGSTFIGEASEAQARQLAEVLSQARIISGRREKSAGRLAVADADELLELVVPMLRKV